MHSVYKKTSVNGRGNQVVHHGVFREDGSLLRGTVTCGDFVQEGLFVDGRLVEGKFDFGDGGIWEGLWALEVVELDEDDEWRCCPGPLVRGKKIKDGDVVEGTFHYH